MEKLIYEKWEEPVGGVQGIIRVSPEGYYLATVKENGDIIFEGREANTRAGEFLAWLVLHIWQQVEAREGITWKEMEARK